MLQSFLAVFFGIVEELFENKKILFDFEIGIQKHVTL